MFTSTLYRKCPSSLQERLISTRSTIRAMLREGRGFRQILSECEKSQWLNHSELIEFTDQKIRKLLKLCNKEVPFYRDTWHKFDDLFKLTPQEALNSLPFLDKEMVNKSGRRLLSDTAVKPLFKGNTSGTTGTPLTLYQNLSAINRENAFIWRQLLWAGHSKGAKRAWIRGDMIVPAHISTAPFWRMNRSENMLMFSSYHLSERNAPAYLDALARFDPPIIQAYPSSIAFLAGYLESTDKYYKGNALKSVVTSSETLSQNQRKTIETRFHCRIFDWYGQFERVAAIGTCEHGRYHIMSDYSYVEFLPTDSGLYEIVGTGYNNLVMPLIRYRTGDFVELDDCTYCPCGRTFPVVRRIYGRNDDFVKLSDGRCIGRMDHIFKDVEGILEAQIVQNAIGELLIRIVPGPGYSSAVDHQLLKNAHNRLGDGVSIHIDQCDNIERTRNGKFRNVICNV